MIQKLILKKNPEIDLYLLSALGDWIKFSKSELFPIVRGLSNKYNDNLVYQEAVINSLRGVEEDYQLFLRENNIQLEDSIISDILKTVALNKKENNKNNIYSKKPVKVDNRIAGYNIFRNLCATCHGIEGEGIESLSPPLMRSEYVTESSERLALVILHGLSGPIHVNGVRYELNIAMPGLANNSDFSDEDIQSIIEYLHNAFPGDAKKIGLEKIKILRKQKPKDGVGFTEEELLEIN